MDSLTAQCTINNPMCIATHRDTDPTVQSYSKRRMAVGMVHRTRPAADDDLPDVMVVVIRHEEGQPIGRHATGEG